MICKQPGCHRHTAIEQRLCIRPDCPFRDEQEDREAIDAALGGAIGAVFTSAAEADTAAPAAPAPDSSISSGGGDFSGGGGSGGFDPGSAPGI